jgi:hypothetical protein
MSFAAVRRFSCEPSVVRSVVVGLQIWYWSVQAITVMYSSGPYQISDCPEEESLNTWWADSQGSETGLKYCTLFRVRKWALTSVLETLRAETGAPSLQGYNWAGRKSVRKLEDLPKVGSRYLVADSINGSMCLVGVSVAGYFLDRTHVTHL